MIYAKRLVLPSEYAEINFVKEENGHLVWDIFYILEEVFLLINSAFAYILRVVIS